MFGGGQFSGNGFAGMGGMGRGEPERCLVICLNYPPPPSTHTHMHMLTNKTELYQILSNNSILACLSDCGGRTLIYFHSFQFIYFLHCSRKRFSGDIFSRYIFLRDIFLKGLLRVMICYGAALF